MSKPTNILLVDEIFASIQGESTLSGLPTLFIRFFGCDVGCSYCDQPQCKENVKKMSIGQIVGVVRRHGIPNVCITGGEPLNQWGNVYALILELTYHGFNVSIETSGCKPIDKDYYNRSFKYIMDIKCPSSGVSDKNVLDNLFTLQQKDELKFVIADKRDYDYMKSILRKYPVACQNILVSPVISKKRGRYFTTLGSDLVKWLLEDRLFNVRVQMQLHKFLGVQ